MDKNRWIGSVRYVGIGWFIATCIVVGILGGVWLDGKLGLAPLFTLLGLFVGLATAFWGVYRTLFPTRKS